MSIPRERGDYIGRDEPTTPVRPIRPKPDSPLTFETFAELAASIDAQGPRRWLLRGIWPAGDYGVLAADAKAQKTWNAVDAAVSVATATPWLGTFPAENPGPVVMFVGEGGRANTVRRVRAVARARGITTDHLDIHVCARAPRLADEAHMAAFADQLDAVEPSLVTLDPLYLSTGAAAKIGDLPAMGALLEKPQRLCQATGTSLMVVHHQNRSEGRGAGRMSGAGPAEWGRVLISGTVRSRHTDPDTRETRVITELDVIGGEVPDRTIRVDRTIRAENPDDLASPLIYAVRVGDEDTPTTTGRQPADDMPPSARNLLAALRALGKPSTGSELADHIENTGAGKRPARETLSRSLAALHRSGYVDSTRAAGKATLWRPLDTENPDPEAAT